MEAALTDVMSGALTRAAGFVTEFSPVLYVIAGILLAMWVLVWARDYFSG